MITIHFAVIALGVVAVLLRIDRVSLPVQVLAITTIVLGTAVWAGVFEGRRWARPMAIAHVIGGLAVAWSVAM